MVCVKDGLHNKVTVTMTASETVTIEHYSTGLSTTTKALLYSEDLTLDQIIDFILVSDFCSQQVQFICDQSGELKMQADWVAWTGKKFKFNEEDLDGECSL